MSALERSLPYVAVTLLAILAACDDGKLVDVETETESIPSSIDPNPDGVLLPGDAGGPALDGVVDMLQWPAPLGERDGSYLTSRLEGWIASGATIGDVNTALETHGARILSMMEGVPLVTLVIDDAGDADALRARAAELQSSDAFLMVVPGMGPTTPAPPPEGGSLAPEAPHRVSPANDTVPEHLVAARSPAAWNATGRALSVGSTVPVLIPDLFSSLDPHPEVPAMRFPAGLTGAATPGSNHGWHVAGTVAAEFEGNAAVGIHPDASALLDVQAIPVGGLTWAGMIGQIRSRMPPSGNFVVSTSLGWRIDAIHEINGGNWTADQMMTGFLQAIAWRKVIAGSEHRFLHATAAGNERSYAGSMNRAELASLWTMAHAFDDPRDGIFPGLLSADQLATADSVWQDVLAHYHEASVRTPNIVIVGSSDAFSGESGFSNLNPTVRAVGEAVLSVCLVMDEEGDAPPDGCVLEMSGTSMATPQIAGMAAWMWNLRPDWTASMLRERLVAAYADGLTDHYALTLAADESWTDTPVRRAILDVAGPTAAPGSNGLFDQHDIELYLELFDSYASLFGAEDYSRYDLSGDGFTDPVNGYGGVSSIDLDLDGLAIGTVSYVAGGDTVHVDEGFLGDRDVLCYYAYSSLYDGDEAARDALVLADCGGAQALGLEVVEWTEEVPAGESSTLTVRVRRGSDVTPGENVVVSVEGGTSTPASGQTDAEGRFSSVVSFEPGSTSVTVTVTAGDPSGEHVETTVTATTTAPGRVTPLSMSGTVQAGSVVQARYETVSDTPPNYTAYGVPVASISEERVTSASIGNEFGSGTATSEASLDLTVTESEPGVVSAFSIVGAAAATSAISEDGSANGSNEVNFGIDFEIESGSVPYSFEMSLDPGLDPGAWTRFAGPFDEAYSEQESAPDGPVTRSFSGVLGPGSYSIQFSRLDAEAGSSASSPEPMSDQASVTINIVFGEAAASAPDGAPEP